VLVYGYYAFPKPSVHGFPTTVDPTDRSCRYFVQPPTVPSMAWLRGYQRPPRGGRGRCRRACERTPLRGRRRCAAGGHLLDLAIAPARFLLRELLNVLATRSGFGPRPPSASATTRPRVVAHGSQTQQRPVRLQAHRKRLPPRRFQQLRMGSRAERRTKLPSTRFLGRFGPTATHHVERTSSSPAHHRVVSTPTTRTACPPTQGQHRRGRYPHQANHTVARYDDRAAPARLWYLLDTNDIHIRPRYIRSAANIRADTLSREQDTEEWQLNPRLFAHLEAMCPVTHSHRLYAQHAAPTLHRKMARPSLPTPPRHGVAVRKQLLHPHWTALPTLTTKLRQSSTTAAIMAPNWPNKTWYQDL
jgi:hypothetical protein